VWWIAKLALIYTGVDHGVVHIAYREYYNNMARPAFSHDLCMTYRRAGKYHSRCQNKIDGANQKVINYTVVKNRGSCVRKGIIHIPGRMMSQEWWYGMLIDKEGHILRVFDFNAAKRAGLREGDEVLQVDSKPLPLGDLG